MLFDPARHDALGDIAWDEGRVRAAIRAIALDTERERLAAGHWPVHPLDDEGEDLRTGFKGLYLGSAGVLWALWALQRAGAVQLASDLAEAIGQMHADYLTEPDTGEVVPSYFMGEAGILLVQWRLTGSAVVADRLWNVVRSNISNPTHEAFWGAPGTLLAAWHLWQATREARWRELVLENVEQVWQTWVYDEKTRTCLWTQHLDGKGVQYFGAGHGFAGNAGALLKAASLLDAGRPNVLYERCLATLQATAKFDADAINWPPGTYTPRPGRPAMLMQWCHGAPGIVTGLADFPARHSSALDALLVGAGHAVWQAGPLTKGHGLCHGTAGNGQAFLTLYRRTGDPVWLERARRFAMHAMDQRERLRQEHGQGRHTLWTGDPGLAIYLWQCLQGIAGLPGLDWL